MQGGKEIKFSFRHHDEFAVSLIEDYKQINRSLSFRHAFLSLPTGDNLNDGNF